MYRYHSAHAWVKMDNSSATIGLSFYAQAHLGEIVFVDLLAPGTVIQAGRAMAEIESAKTTSEVVAPISGRVIEANQRLEMSPTLINDSPLDEGWIVRVTPSDLSEMENLMAGPAYEAYLVETVKED